MPSSKSSLDHRDVYYRLGKSSGYRARSAYKLLHLDEEFDLFTGGETAVDLCAAPGSWSQVLGQKLKPSKEGRKVVALDLQPMAPLPNITILQTDITLPSTIPLVLNALGGRKADLVVCDGAPDVTGVHDLDAYLHSQLILAALTLSLTLLAPHATLIFKIFLSPLDPRGAMIRSQLELFFQAPSTVGASNSPRQKAFDECDGATSETYAESSTMEQIAGKPGFDSQGRRGGVWVRKPRSSRKGSGEAFIVCRNFDPSRVPLPETFPPAALAELERQTSGTLTLDSLAYLGDTGGTAADWEMIKAYVGSGDLNGMSSGADRDDAQSHRSPLIGLRIDPGSTPSDGEPTDLGFDSPTGSAPHFAETDDSAFLSSSKLHIPIHLPTPYISKTIQRTAFSDGTPTRQRSGDSLSPPSSASPTSSTFSRPWDRRGPSPLPSPNIFAPGAHPDSMLSMQDQQGTHTPMEGGILSSVSSGSKTDLFFASGQDSPPLPPKSLTKVGLLGRGHPNGGVKGHERAASLPMPRLEGIKGHGRSTDDTPATIMVTTPTPTSPAVSSPNRAVQRSTSSPNPRGKRDISGQIPSSPLATLPTLPEVAGLAARQSSQRLPQETHEILEDTLQAGDILVPLPDEEPRGDIVNWELQRRLGEGAFSSVWSAVPSPPTTARNTSVAAIKLTDKRLCSANSRTKIAFIREVEVLRHISHRNIVSFLASFSTSTHHCLVLERLGGGELFELVGDEENRRRMMLPGTEDPAGEGFVRRVFGELARAMGWLHEVGVVHRDIKLENILLTTNPFHLPPTSTSSIPLSLLSTPLIKLTDFGLSRFISPSSPLLQTRCGSESFAAPEIIMGRAYDGRDTDSWACGVVLFALISGSLPFDEDVGKGEREERKRRMMRIAKGSFTWPVGVGSEGARKVVARLLVRDPKKRSRVGMIWDEDWMKGPGEVESPVEGDESRRGVMDGGGGFGGGRRRVLDGFLVDGDGIGEIALAEEAE